MNGAKVVSAAAALRAAEDDRCPILPLSESWPDMTVVDAYAVQQANLAQRLDDGARVVGHKIGLTSEAMQRQLGVSEPDFGYILDDMVVESGTTLNISEFCSPRAEPEIAFQFHDSLAGPECRPEDVLRAVARVAPALEIIDSRIAEWHIALVDTVADNASAGAVVLGKWVDFAGQPLEAVAVSMSKNGEEVGAGHGRDVLGHPAAAVAWLVRKLHEFGGRIDPGHVVLPGSCTAATSLAAGDVVVAEMRPLGLVEVRWTNDVG